MYKMHYKYIKRTVNVSTKNQSNALEIFNLGIIMDTGQMSKELIYSKGGSLFKSRPLEWLLGESVDKNKIILIFHLHLRLI